MHTIVHATWHPSDIGSQLTPDHVSVIEAVGQAEMDTRAGEQTE